MSEESNNTEFQKLAEEATEREIERIEKEKGKLTEEEKEKLHKNYFSKFLYEVRLKHFAEKEYVPKDPPYDFEDSSE